MYSDLAELWRKLADQIERLESKENAAGGAH
jgi:hypothetical protein